MASGDTKTEAMLNALGNGGSADEFRGCCNTKTQQYILDAIDRVQNVEDEVEELKNNPDVVDIVNTYADLQAYDKSTLTDKDIIRVLEDSTHSNKSTYYRYSASTDSFTYIGEAGSSVTVVQTTGTSQTDVMSQNAVTSMVFADPGTGSKVKIGTGASALSDLSVVVGTSANDGGAYYNTLVGSGSVVGNGRSACIGIGFQANVSADNSIAIGRQTKIQQFSSRSSVALGAWAEATRKGEVNIGAGTSGEGYNSTNYRVLGGVHDAVDTHDAVTLGQLNTRLGNLTITTISQSDYNNLQTKDPNTLYLITGA